MNISSDILWANSSDGAIQIWFMDDHKIVRRHNVVDESGTQIPIGPPWNIVGVGDFSRVRTAIDERYAQLGAASSWLGTPTSAEVNFSENGRVRSFQHGAIYWWGDTGAIELGDVILRYKGIYCFGETDESSAHDEPYVAFGVVPVPPGQTTTATTQIYADVDAGDARPDQMELYRGSPLGLQLGLVMAEHDYGDPDKFLDEIKMGVTAAGKAVAAGCGALGGPLAAGACEVIWKELSTAIVDFVNDLAGTDDDLVDKWDWIITAKEMVTLARAQRHEFWGIEYHFESKLLSDDEASYKVYLDLQVA